MQHSCSLGYLPPCRNSHTFLVPSFLSSAARVGCALGLHYHTITIRFFTHRVFIVVKIVIAYSYWKECMHIRWLSICLLSFYVFIIWKYLCIKFFLSFSSILFISMLMKDVILYVFSTLFMVPCSCTNFLFYLFNWASISLGIITTGRLVLTGILYFFCLI